MGILKVQPHVVEVVLVSLSDSDALHDVEKRPQPLHRRLPVLDGAHHVVTVEPVLPRHQKGRLLLAKELVLAERLIQQLFHELVVDGREHIVRTFGVSQDRDVRNAPPTPALPKHIDRLGALVEQLGPVTVSTSVWPSRLVADPTAANELVPGPVHRHVELMVLELRPFLELLHGALHGPCEKCEVLSPTHSHLAVATTRAAVVVHVLREVRPFAVLLATDDQGEAGVAHDEVHAIPATGCPGSDAAKAFVIDSAQRVHEFRRVVSRPHSARALQSSLCSEDLLHSLAVLRPCLLEQSVRCKARHHSSPVLQVALRILPEVVSSHSGYR